MTEPLPCPFCGVTPTVRSHGIHCENEACPVQPEVDGMTGALEPADHLRRWNTRAPVRPTRKLIPVCPDCNNPTHDHDTVEGMAHCRYCGYGVDADE